MKGGEFLNCDVFVIKIKYLQIFRSEQGLYGRSALWNLVGENRVNVNSTGRQTIQV